METRSDASNRVARWGLFAGMMAAVYAANWAIEQWGVVGLPLTGLEAPAGVYFAGLTFGLRDALHEVGGARWVVAAIVAGAALSYALSDGAAIPGGHATIALASGVAFLLSEFADFAIYAPLRRRHWTGAVVASNVIGAVVDSALFLWLAFGGLDFLAGQVVGKVAMIVPALPIVWLARRRYSNGI